MITDVQYMQIINEVYDLSDYKTKKKMLFCNEAEKTANVEHIVNVLYNHIKAKSTSIDFGTIPKSKGVVTRVDNYTQIVNCINTIHDLVLSYHENTNLVDELSTALNNIQSRERVFAKAFTLNIDFPMMMYNTAVLSVVSATSLLITTSIEYIKNGHDSFSLAFDKAGYVKTQEHVLYQYIRQFNKICADGSLDKTIELCIKNNVTSANESSEYLEEGIRDVAKDLVSIGLSGGGIALGKAALDMAKNTRTGKIALIIIGAGIAIIGAINLLRVSIYYWCHMRMKVSDWFEIQADFLQINAENLKYREDPKGDDHKKVVYQKQMKWVEKFRKISNVIALKDMKAKKETNQENDEYSKKRKAPDNDDHEDDGGLF